MADDGEDDRSGRADTGERDDGGGLSLQLPPIRLPPFFPEDFRVLWPAGGRPRRRRVSATTVLLVCLGFDALDAVLALTAHAPLVTATRTVGGALAAALTLGPVGALYVWEPLAALFGYGQLTAFPTLGALLVVRALR